jgi:protein-S-isoprenylcysteine O-methyltransferase Ste14
MLNLFNIADYGLWELVIVNSMIFIIFTFSFFRPRTGRDWRTFGAFSAFLVALFTEMYGFPLTVYLLSGWLASRFPEIDWLSHNSGHLLQTMLGWQGNPHFGPLHLLSDMLVLGGLILLASSWKVLYRAQKNLEVARSGPYAKIRHPQYTAFIIIMIGFLVQWPTLPTLLLFPILVLLYIRLARSEEKEALKMFGDRYARYVQSTPGFIPRIQLNAAAQRLG